MPETLEPTKPTFEPKPIVNSVRSIASRLKDELAKPGLVVAATEVSTGNYRVNWVRHEAFGRVVASKFLHVEDHNGQLIITDKSSGGCAVTVLAR